ncbi:MAG TPA: WD40 repeat domain-containing protein [Solirubrobacteraceae bacterium]|nr:WD40 repeat domain-containing protein [Solirubrobacteraceae bacterium]
MAKGRLALLLGLVGAPAALAGALGLPAAADTPASPAGVACHAVLVKVRAKRWAWVPRTRRVHGRRVLLERNGKPLYVRVRVRYFKHKHVSVCVSATAGTAPAASAGTGAGPQPGPGAGSPEGVSHLEYVLANGLISVYDIDRGFALVKTISLPQTNSQVRGVTVAPSTHLMFISFGGDGPLNGSGNGSVLAYDLVSDRVAWEVRLATGVDSGQVSPDATRLYMPSGENTSSGIWNVLSTRAGERIGAIQGGSGAHNTIASNDGRFVYLGGRNSNYLDAYETATGTVKAVGPLIGSVRPFTVNGSNTLAFTGATGFDGFQVSQIRTGKVLFTVSFGPVPKGFPFTAPSHGISLSPDERQLYVIDSVHKQVQFWDVSRVGEGLAPAQLGIVPVAGLSATEHPCVYDCGRSGWLQLSSDGRLLFVGDSGEVIDTRTRTVVTTLATLAQTKKSIEVDWQSGAPVATSGRTGVGYIAGN